LIRRAIKVGNNTSVDQFVGRRIRERRRLLGLRSQELGATIGLLPQQISRYERGMQSVSAGLLFEIADALDTPATFSDKGSEHEPIGEVLLEELRTRPASSKVSRRNSRRHSTSPR
jgi:transcriptional regulator with XRE-family HTH domain